MIKLDFEDVIESKYKATGKFSEGLAPVLGQNNLWGYIDKKGNEVIPCQFKKAFNFSEGLALVSNKDDKVGYIDIAGELKIPFQFADASSFKEGSAAVKDDSGLFGYINQEGYYLIEPSFDDANPFSEGFAVVEMHNESKHKSAHVNKEGKTFGNFFWVQKFVNGSANVSTGTEVYTVDYNYEKQSKFNLNGKSLFSEHCGLKRFEDANGKYGYLDRDFNFIIPCIFIKANDFQDDVAIVQLTDNTQGFVTKDGKITLFSTENQYQEIGDFSEGLAPVKGINDLWGFINKNGKEVIRCQYKEVDPFSEGLSGVIDCNDVYHYINKNGTKKITIGMIYKSALDTGYETVFITADSEKQLCEKKLEVLNQVKERLIQRVTDSVDKSSCDITSELYELSKKKSKKADK